MSGLSDKIQGSAKQVVGKATGDDKTEAKGTTQKIVGNLKDKAEDIKDQASEKANDVLKNAEDKTKNDK